MFIVPLYTIRCQSGPMTRFALRRFCRGGWRCSLPGHCATQIFHQETVTTHKIVRNWRGNMLVKVLCRCDLYFLKYTRTKLTNCRFRENLTFDPQTGSNFDLWRKIAPPIASTRWKQSAIFFSPLSSVWPLVSKRAAGVVSTPPPLQVRVVKSCVHGRGLSFIVLCSSGLG